MHMAPQFWRFLPALALATSPLFVLLSHAFIRRVGMLPGLDWETLRFALIGAAISAGVAFYQAARLDRVTAFAVIAAGLSLDWCVFDRTGQYGLGAGAVELLMLGL